MLALTKRQLEIVAWCLSDLAEAINDGERPEVTADEAAELQRVIKSEIDREFGE